MKTKLLLTTLLSFSFYLLSSQVPQGFNYQAIARGSDGKEIANTTMQVKVSILSDTSGFYAGGTGTYLWEEQQTVKTNGLGLFTLTIGNPVATKIQGSAISFSAIDWNQQPLFIGTKINNSGWKNMGTSRLWTVPYAMVASDVKGLSKLQVTGNATSMDSALFEVKNKNGQTVFAVYNEGVRVYVDDGVAKGTGKGGFAIGSFGTAKGTSQPLFLVNADSIRGYIDTNPVKALKGGFAIGSFSPAKAPGEEYLRVTRDSTRINVTQPAKGRKGGFAIGSFSPVKGQSNYFMDMSPKNYFIGDSAGASTFGQYNSFMGYKAGAKNTSGSTNAFVGYQAGYRNLTGFSNLFVGYQTGFSNLSGNYNSFIGYQAGYSNTSGLNNSFMGSYAGTYNTTGGDNTFLGFYAGYLNTTGNNNSFIGSSAGYHNTIGKSNVFIGPGSGFASVVGDSNIFVGVKAGTSNFSGRNNIFLGSHSGLQFTTGNNNICLGLATGIQSFTTSDNIFIGYHSGQYGTNPGITVGGGNIWIGKYAGWNLAQLWNDQFSASYLSRNLENTLVIDQNESFNGFFYYGGIHYPSGDLNKYPLIFGNFTFETGRRGVTINGVYGYTYMFFVNGQAGGKSSWGTISDARMKKNIVEIPNALSKVMNLRGVNFEWKDTVNSERGTQMGFIAQEAEKVIPEVVMNKGDAYSMYYAPITALLVEGMKEQQKIIESQKSELENQQKRIQTLELKMEQIESLLSKSGLK